MPADPGANLGWKKLSTKKKDIGHVAPSFEDKPRFNTLVVRPQYRISLRLGDIENLFPWDINTKAGRLARLQVLGLFYWPLNHRVGAGKTAKPGNPARLADNEASYDFMWGYFKEKFCGNGNDAAAENELKRRLREWVVQKFDGTGHGTGGELPQAVETDDQGEPKKAAELAKGHFAKIRLPGGWSFLHSNGDHVHNLDSSVSGMEMYDPKHGFEEACYNVNPVLGRIPLIAKVEKLEPSTNTWRLAKNVWVYFQLLRPYDLPDFINDINRLNNQPNCPTLREGAYSVTDPNPPNRPNRGGPKYFTHIWENYQVDGNDPRVNNCHKNCGGKRGNSVSGTDVNKCIFMLGRVDGFSKAHRDPETAYSNVDAEDAGERALDPEPSLKKVRKPRGNNHPHAVRALTNDDGEAGVIFMPSRCGGDRYRIRAYVGSPTLKGPGSNGKGMNAVRVDTGTFVVWRNIRMSRWVRQQVTEAGLSNVMVNQRYGRAGNAVLGANDKKDWMRDFRVVDAARHWRGLPHHDMHTVSDVNVGDQFEGFRAALARAFCEFEEDPGFAIENLTQGEWDAAVLCGLEDAKQVGLAAGPHGLPAAVRAGFGPPNNWLETLLFREAGNTDGITVGNGFCIPSLTAAAFDARTGTTMLTGPNHLAWKSWVAAIFQRYLVSGFMRHITKNAYLPGITFIQAAHVTNLALEAGFNMGYSGLATHYHGAYVLYGREAYPVHVGDAADLTYGYTPNATHEMGHVLFSVHAPGNNNHNSCAGGVRTVGGNDCTTWHDCHDLLVDNANNITNANFPAGHDNAGEPRGNPGYGACLMSYRRCEGQFCSRCLFQLRGWNTRSAQMRAGDANLPPFFEPVKTQWIKEGQQLTVDLSAKDMHGRALTFTAVNLPDGGNLVDNNNGTAKFTWTPASGTAGIHTVTFRVTEVGAPPHPDQTDTAVVAITVLR